jgi:hypothetical protein
MKETECSSSHAFHGIWGKNKCLHLCGATVKITHTLLWKQLQNVPCSMQWSKMEWRDKRSEHDAGHAAQWQQRQDLASDDSSPLNLH